MSVSVGGLVGAAVIVGQFTYAPAIRAQQAPPAIRPSHPTAQEATATDLSFPQNAWDSSPFSSAGNQLKMDWHREHRGTVAPSALWHREHRGTLSTVAPWHRQHRGTVAPSAPWHREHRQHRGTLSSLSYPTAALSPCRSMKSGGGSCFTRYSNCRRNSSSVSRTVAVSLASSAGSSKSSRRRRIMYRRAIA